MLKNTLLAAATLLTVIGSASLPANAFGIGDLAENANPPQEVPEPSTILGTLVVSGIGLMISKKKDMHSNEEQN